MTKEKLKGGSLSGTYLIIDNDRKFIRKEISLTKNREYGFQRWYSQLKKLQRFSVQFPGLFPNVLEVGLEDDIAYFDMEFIENAVNAHDFLSLTTDTIKIEKFFNRLIQSLKTLHNQKIKTNPSAIKLYVREEITQRLKDCEDNVSFMDFINNDKIIFNGEEVDSFIKVKDIYDKMFEKYYQCEYETFTHGNLTLENLMYDEINDIVYFIDPYEENIVDSVLGEYSQILQSSNSKYEIYNKGTSIVYENSVNMKIEQSVGINYFNHLFYSFLKHSPNLNENDYVSIKLLEVSQFIRMIPFKKVVNENMMIFFYSLASKLFKNIREKYE